MNLQLKLILKKKSPRTIFELHRKDKSSIFSKIHPGMELHELGHWAVESSLALEDAFFGLISEGYTIEDFEKPRDQRPVALMPKNLSASAIFVEHYVNLLMTELNSGINHNFFEQLNEICNSKRIDIPNQFKKERVEQIRSLYLEKVNLWKDLELGKEMVLWI